MLKEEKDKPDARELSLAELSAASGFRPAPSYYIARGLLPAPARPAAERCTAQTI